MSLFIPKDRRSLFRQFLGGMYDAVVITDPNGHIIDLNPRATEYFGHTLEEVLDQPIGVLVPGLQQAVVQRIRKGLEGDRHVVIDANARAKDGAKFACEVTVSSIDLMNPGDLVFTMRNVERRRALMLALRSKANAFELSQAAMFVCDESGLILQMNVAFRELFGIADGTTEAKFSDYLNDEPLPEDFARALNGETTITVIVAENEDEVEEGLEITLAPNMVGRKTAGVVGSIVRTKR